MNSTFSTLVDLDKTSARNVMDLRHFDQLSPAVFQACFQIVLPKEKDRLLRLGSPLFFSLV
uniref:Uncharacterized protein n=1 Tax=Populus trichocarpa TaxID=3694 RepID=A0A2K1YT16_POPTR